MAGWQKPKSQISPAGQSLFTAQLGCGTQIRAAEQAWPVGQGLAGPHKVIGVHWLAMHTALTPQSASLAQLMLATQAPVRKSQVVPLGQSLGRVQPVGGGGGATHIPETQSSGAGQVRLAQGSVAGTHCPFAHTRFGGQSPEVLQPGEPGAHIPFMQVSPGGQTPGAQPLPDGTQKPNRH